METGKITFTKNKKGDWVGNIILSNGKSLNFPYAKSLKDVTPESLDGNDIELKRVNGKTDEIWFNKKLIYSLNQALQNVPAPNRVQQQHPNQAPQHNHNQDNNKIAAANAPSAKAPYNFVPLNKIVVESEFDIETSPHNTFNNGFSGFIDLDITTKTPLYIRDCLDKSDLVQKKEKEKGDSAYINSDFYSPNKRYSIPGSSIRGMVRSLNEIVTFGKFGFFDDTKLYYRSFTDKCKGLVDEYSQKMRFTDPKTQKQILRSNSGLLFRKGNRYFIKPADKYYNKIIDQNFYYNRDNSVLFIDYIKVEGEASKQEYYRFSKVADTETQIQEADLKQEETKGEPNILSLLSLYEEIVNSPDNRFISYSDSVKIGKIRERYKYLPLFYRKSSKSFFTKPVKESVACLVRKEKGNYFAKFYSTPSMLNYDNLSVKKEIADIIKNNKVEQFFVELADNRFFVVSGHMQNKRRHYIVHSNMDSDKTPIEITYEYAKSYDNDVQRKGPNLIALLKKRNYSGKVLPCFYIDDKINGNTVVTSISQTPMLRLAYQKTVNEHLPANLINKETLDITEAVFGVESKFMTRVFFEDAFLKQGFEDKIGKNEITPKILSSPKSTSFQNYLEQSTNNPANLQHFNNEAHIRGNKLFWHKNSPAFSANQADIDKNPKQYTKIKPISEGALFSGRIRFENLSKVELGALLFVLKLKDNLFHKIGMAKPLGLGSVKITPKLFISDKKLRYSGFLTEWGNLTPSENEKEFISEFEKHILVKLGRKDLSSLWDEARMKELSIMLSFPKAGVQDNNVYMDLKEFRNRPILPKPSTVAK